ncbi:class A beta-lactamase [Streptomyces sp. NRRL F-4489]|uniref:class A beta-lactamase n=1 Tax=Streptomyces sp. NRRL F-4489 TaxID=1609095 RepID=UPI0007470DC1|nr:class A beta-lactamase [Streptomyces sp. NRRL F-4489]KUL38929.1 class A beta-lactamase [Streptomyces sp. NRRL F-4489]
MPAGRPDPSRRALLAAAALLPLTGCTQGHRPPAQPAPTPSRRAANPANSPAVTAQFTSLERKYGARLGVHAVATGTGATISYRADERFAFCSTFKALAAAAVLHHNPLSHLDQRITYTARDINSISPITQHHIATGMTLRELCDAAIRYSDGTAGNLLLRDLGGPSQLTAYLRDLGDRTSRLDRYEPELNRDRPEDPRDTTTPRALAADYQRLLLGDALPPAKHALLKDWLVRNATGGRRIRAGLPPGWTVADKTGTGDYGRANDVAIIWPPHMAPLVIALQSDRPGYSTPPQDALLAETTTHLVAALTT